MRRSHLAAALLLVYPALLLAGSVSYALRYESRSPITDKLPLVIAAAAVAIGLLRDRRWAYGAALVLGAGVAAIVPLYWYAATLSGGWETWRGMSAIRSANAVLAPLASGPPSCCSWATRASGIRDDGFRGRCSWAWDWSWD